MTIKAVLTAFLCIFILCLPVSGCGGSDSDGNRYSWTWEQSSPEPAPEPTPTPILPPPPADIENILAAGAFQYMGYTPIDGIPLLDRDGRFLRIIDTSGVYIDALEVQRDGKIVLAGAFKTVSGQPAPGNVIRLNSDWTLDKTFAPVRTLGSVAQIKITSDQNILLMGSFWSVNDAPLRYLAKLGPGGVPDTTFSIRTDNTIRTMALQGEKILISGLFETVNETPQPYIARLNADGSLDRSFAPRFNRPQAILSIFHLAVQNDGKIVAGGSFSTVNGISQSYLARLNADGTTDSSFRPVLNGTVNYVALQHGGGVLAAGSFGTVGGFPQRQLARFLPDGSADPEFRPLINNILHGMAVQSDDAVVFWGNFTSVDGSSLPYIARLRDGAPDEAFMEIKPGAAPYQCFILPDDRIVMESHAAFTGLYGNLTSVVRLSASGRPDKTFSSRLWGSILSLERRQDGKILIAGDFTSLEESVVQSAAVLNADGTPDPSFQPFFSSGDGQIPVMSAFTLPNGQILAGGQLAYLTSEGAERKGVARLNTDGSIDETFRATVNGTVRKILLLKDGKILAAGEFSQANGAAAANLAVFNSDGSRDGAFTGNTDGTVYAAAVQNDGKILIAGSFTETGGKPIPYLARLLPGGEADEGFRPPVPDSWVTSVDIGGDGTVAAAGYFSRFGANRRNGAAKIGGDGTLDLYFNPPATGGEIYCIGIQSDGKVLVGGDFSGPQDQDRSCLARLNIDGSPDGSFEKNLYSGPIRTLLIEEQPKKAKHSEREDL